MYFRRLIILVRKLGVVERSRNDWGKTVFPAPFDFAQGGVSLS